MDWQRYKLHDRAFNMIFGSLQLIFGSLQLIFGSLLPAFGMAQMA
jgi:hypothetical protein